MRREGKVAVTLRRFANAREKALTISGCLSGPKAAAIARIKQVASFFKNSSDRMQLRCVQQVETELYEILPDPESRFAKQAQSIINLIAKSHAESNQGVHSER